MQTDATVAMGFVRAKFMTPLLPLVATTTCDIAPQGLIGLWHSPVAASSFQVESLRSYICDQPKKWNMMEDEAPIPC